MSLHPFLEGLESTQREQLLAGARRERFAAGAFVFHMNGAADGVYLIEEGRVTLEVGDPGRGPTQVEEVRAGDLLGLSWLFPPYRWHLDARAAGPVEATVLSGAQVRARMEADPALGRAIALRLLAKVYDRLVRARLQRLDVYRGP
jgi:CRP-like cAMP-binding protein